MILKYLYAICLYHRAVSLWILNTKMLVYDISVSQPFAPCTKLQSSLVRKIIFYPFHNIPLLNEYKKVLFSGSLILIVGIINRTVICLDIFYTVFC